ncbi:hypothetical protein SAMN05443575_3233 [Jatrophihabitans endophyticus]|uniref:Uncharacterized protein n=1 Tax=Jatrophihabitans endophyticus TaxID=1206085 RepID=A0A1M5PYF6_9ACTN|nr:hypothetical protein [Jatrophihabitans endophyticus]SHH06692.1 hypothetical protein SAMN05443575_3233 [Jatrophihabitans endophyticus]
MRILVDEWELGDWSSEDAVVLRVGDDFDRGASDFRAESPDEEFRAALGAELFDSIDAQTYGNGPGRRCRVRGRITAIGAVLERQTRRPDGSLRIECRTRDVAATEDGAGRSTGHRFLVDVAVRP